MQCLCISSRSSRASMWMLCKIQRRSLRKFPCTYIDTSNKSLGVICGKLCTCTCKCFAYVYCVWEGYYFFPYLCTFFVLHFAYTHHLYMYNSLHAIYVHVQADRAVLGQNLWAQARDRREARYMYGLMCICVVNSLIYFNIFLYTARQAPVAARNIEDYQAKM